MYKGKQGYMSRLRCILDRNDDMIWMRVRCCALGIEEGNEQRRKGKGKDERNGGSLVIEARLQRH